MNNAREGDSSGRDFVCALGLRMRRRSVLGHHGVVANSMHTTSHPRDKVRCHRREFLKFLAVGLISSTQGNALWYPSYLYMAAASFGDVDGCRLMLCFPSSDTGADWRSMFFAEAKHGWVSYILLLKFAHWIFRD